MSSSDNLLSTYHKRPVLYLAYVETSTFSGIKFGITDDIRKREIEHRRDFSTFQLIRVYETYNNRDVESKLKYELRLRNLLAKTDVNGKTQTELINMQDTDVVSILSLVQRIIDANVHPLQKELDDTSQKVQELHMVVNHNLKLEQLKLEVALANAKAKSDAALAKQLELRVELERLKAQKQMETCDSEKCESLEACADVMHEVSDQNKKSYENPIEEFIDTFCIMGIDTQEDKYRIPCSVLYQKYQETAAEPVHKKEFESYVMQCLMSQFNTRDETALKRPINYHGRTTLGFYNIRLKIRVQTPIESHMTKFIENTCMCDQTYSMLTTDFYKSFEKYLHSNGFQAVKQNGYSPQNMKTMLLRHKGIGYLKYGYKGKKAVFTGIKLKNSIPSPIEAYKLFVDDCLYPEYGQRIRNADIKSRFNEYTSTQWGQRYQIYFHENTAAPFKNLYEYIAHRFPSAVQKSVTQSEKGFVGIRFK